MIGTTRILVIFVQFESNSDREDFALTCKYDNKDNKDIYLREPRATMWHTMFAGSSQDDSI